VHIHRHVSLNVGLQTIGLHPVLARLLGWTAVHHANSLPSEVSNILKRRICICQRNLFIDEDWIAEIDLILLIAGDHDLPP